MSDLRALCAELFAAFNTYAVGESHHDLLWRTRAELAKTPPPTFLDAIRLAKGSHDYSGGYGGTPCDEAFHAGISTVVNVLTKAATGPWDYQTIGVFEAGAPQPAADGEVAAGPAVQSREPASVTTEPNDQDLDDLAEEHLCFDVGSRREYARAVLARWGTAAPQPIPVSERLQQIEDLAADAMAGLRYIEHWHGRLSGVGWDRLHEKATRLNPAHALPLPTTTETNND